MDAQIFKGLPELWKSCILHSNAICTFASLHPVTSSLHIKIIFFNVNVCGQKFLVSTTTFSSINLVQQNSKIYPKYASVNLFLDYKQHRFFRNRNRQVSIVMASLSLYFLSEIINSRTNIVLLVCLFLIIKSLL